MIAAGVAVAAAIGGATAYVAVPANGVGPWTPIWVDNFAGAAHRAPSARNWQVDTGAGYPGGPAEWGTGEIETYTNKRANLALDGHGHLRITALKNSAGAWTSGRLETKRASFRPTAGHALKVAARIKLPAGGQGYWPAFWMLGKPFRGTYTNWPGIGEIDILENIGREPAVAHGTLHCGVNPGGPCHETNGVTGAYTNPSGTPLAAAFHTYSVVWDRTAGRDEIRWYVDAHRFFTVRASAVGATAWRKATGHGFFLLLNLAIGGGWAGAPDASTAADRSMLIDQVSVSRR